VKVRFFKYKDPVKSLSGSRPVHTYPAKVVGLDALSDLAVVSMNASLSDLYSLDLSSSSSLKVVGTLVRTPVKRL
jgi:S1-C subfamily serine protease